MKRKIFLLICAVLIAALLIGVLAACDPGSKEQGGSQTPGGTQLPGNGEGGGTQTPGDNDQDDEQGGEVIEPAKLIFEKTDAGYTVTGYEGTPTVVVIPETYEGLPVTSIGWGAFAGCTSLTSVTIPDSVTSIGQSAFTFCPSLERLTVAPGNPAYRSAGNCIIETETGTLIQGCNNSVIPMDGSVTRIGAYAFAYCDSLASVTIPNSVTSIGIVAFAGCTSLTSVTIGDGVTSIEDYAFTGCYKLVEVYNKSSLDITAGSTANGYVGEYAKHVYTEEGGSWLSDTEDGFRFFYDGETGYLVTYLGNETELTLPDSFTAYDGTEVTSYQIYDYAFLNTHRMMHELIGSNASMSPSSSLTSVTIPNSVTSIGDYAFLYCDSLTAITIGNGVTSIGELAFGYCTSLERLTVAPGNPVYHSAGNCVIETATGTLTQGCNNSVIPSDGSVTSIGDYAFAYCDSLTSVTIPDSVTSIGSSAFSDCTSLTLTSVTIPDSVTSIGREAFSDCTSLTSVTIPDSVTSIGDSAFESCDSLTSVAIGNSVTSIGNSAFVNCHRLVEVYNKSSLEITAGSTANGYVARYAKHVYTEEGGSWLSDTEDGYRFIYDAANDSGYLVAYLGDETELTLPDSFTAYDGTEATSYQIYERAFYGRDDLTAVTIPNSVTSIGGRAFSGCDSLTSVTIGNSVTSIGSYAFSGCAAEIIWGDTPTITQIGAYAFAYYDGTSITIPNSVTSIGDNAFMSCSSLTSVTIPDGATSIGEFAFDGCSSLISVTIPDSVTSIGSEAFYGCTNIVSATMPAHAINDIPQDSLETVVITSGDSIWSYAFEGCTSLTSVTIPDSVTSIGELAFYDCESLEAVHITDIGKWASIEFGYLASPMHNVAELYLNGEPVTDVVIPDGVTSIGEGAFAYCTTLTSIAIPDSVTSIGHAAFIGCQSLKSVYITDIEKWLAIDFEAYANPLTYDAVLYLNGVPVTELVIPESVTVIGDYAFEGCVSLRSVTIGEHVVGIGYGAFSYCSSLTSITIPAGVTKLEGWTFASCTSLASIDIPDGVTSIGDYTFYNCHSLTSITIPEGVESIEQYAFSDCYSLEAVRFEGTVEQWNEVVKGNSWNSNCLFTEVVCSDGVVEV